MFIDLETQLALQTLSECSNPYEATSYFASQIDVLKDWRYIYACENSVGSFPIDNKFISEKVMITSGFYGKSLWIIDEKMIREQNDVLYKMGKGIFLDSNAASYFYSLAYREQLSSQTRNQLNAIQSLNIDYGNLNPALYLWEAQRQFDKKPESLDLCKKTFAAVNCLQLIDMPLNEEWGRIYRKYYQEQAEAEIMPYFEHLIHDLNKGLSKELEYQIGLIEALLLKTKILEYSSSKAAEYKIEQLIRFMDERLSILLIRELSVYADILFHEHKSTISQKLNSLNNQKYPLALIKNCAWDIFLFRIMDMMSNVELEDKPDFYIAEILTCDRDIWGIYNLSALRGIAIHIKSHMSLPFLKNTPSSLLTKWFGEKKAMNLDNVFEFNASMNRMKNHPNIDLEAIITSLQEELLALIKR